jgi:hypothetical protein
VPFTEPTQQQEETTTKGKIAPPEAAKSTHVRARERERGRRDIARGIRKGRKGKEGREEAVQMQL